MIYFNNRNGSSGLIRRLIPRLISATATYGRWNSSLCWKGRWYPTICSPYDIRTIFTSYTTLRKYLCRVKPRKEYIKTKNCALSIPSSFSSVYKGQTYFPLKVKQEEHRKAVYQRENEKSGMADHICKEKGNHLPLWDQVKIIDREEH